MKKTKLRQLKEKIIELVPDIECRNSSIMLKENGFSGLINCRNSIITIGDVILALNKAGVRMSIDFYGGNYLRFWPRDAKPVPHWNLEITAIDMQDTKTIEMLYEKLVVEPA